MLEMARGLPQKMTKHTYDLMQPFRGNLHGEYLCAYDRVSGTTGPALKRLPNVTSDICGFTPDPPGSLAEQSKMQTFASASPQTVQ